MWLWRTPRPSWTRSAQPSPLGSGAGGHGGTFMSPDGCGIKVPVPAGAALHAGPGCHLCQAAPQAAGAVPPMLARHYQHAPAARWGCQGAPEPGIAPGDHRPLLGLGRGGRGQHRAAGPPAPPGDGGRSLTSLGPPQREARWIAVAWAPWDGSTLGQGRPPGVPSCKGHPGQQGPAAAEEGGAAARAQAVGIRRGVACQNTAQLQTCSTGLFSDCGWGWPKAGRDYPRARRLGQG